MSNFKYPYTKTGRGYIFALIPVLLKNKDIKLQYIAQIDSGATFCVFHSDIAIALGINLKDIKEQVVFKGVGSSEKEFGGKLYIVSLMIMQRGESFKFDCPVVFSDNINKDCYPLLGIGGFFENFTKIIFDNENKRVVLES